MTANTHGPVPPGSDGRDRSAWVPTRRPQEERRTERFQDRQRMLEGAALLGDAGWRVDRLIELEGEAIIMEFVRPLLRHRSSYLNVLQRGPDESNDHTQPPEC